MRCSNARNRIVAWIDGELSPAECEDLEEHLAGCPGCHDYTELMRKTTPSSPPGAGGEFPESHWSPMHESVMAAFEAHDLQERKKVAAAWLPPFTRRHVLATAYAATLVLAIGWGWANHKAAVEASVARDSALEQLEHYQRVVAERQPLTPLPNLPQVRPAAYVPYRDTF